MIRSIFLRLLSEFSINARLCALQAVRISNDLYGSDVLSSFEMAKGFTRPSRAWSSALKVDQGIIDAQLQLEAKRRLTKILRSKVILTLNFKYEILWRFT